VRLRSERGLALVFISHDLALVRLLADRTLVLRAGRLVEEGTGAGAAEPSAQTARP
jgi:ABC-type glutathione transport system ATPase component